jgi:hypothetical protein
MADPEVLDLDGIPVRPIIRDQRLKPQHGFLPAAESEFTDLLTAAKCAARPEYKQIRKNAKGNFGMYATLDEVLDAVTPANCKHGLDLSSKTIIVGDEQWEVTTLRHISGQFERSASKLTERQPQKVLSETTYWRRKHSAELCGVAADSDLDGDGLKGAEPPMVNSAVGLARQALRNARTEQERNSVLAKVALSVAAGRISEMQMLELKDERENMPVLKEVANAQS